MANHFASPQPCLALPALLTHSRTRRRMKTRKGKEGKEERKGNEREAKGRKGGMRW